MWLHIDTYRVIPYYEENGLLNKVVSRDIIFTINGVEFRGHTTADNPMIYLVDDKEVLPKIDN